MIRAHALPLQPSELRDPTAPEAAGAEGVRLSSFPKYSHPEAATGAAADPFARYGAPDEDSDGGVEAYA
ncbi:hypothetical protein PVT71_06875 [Salipiger sp. H15]|uniref:Uncharacterized protein n=1 Tax=Alloyangia sp. H15 TaxID=3029062 RepID=A0AAU8AKA4_9RHOB